jgi:hypothetical protein
VRLPFYNELDTNAQDQVIEAIHDFALSQTASGKS